MEKNDKIFNITVSLVTCVVFFGTLTGFEPAGLGAATAFSEKKEFSETKNQYLAKFPEFTAKKVYNGSFAREAGERLIKFCKRKNRKAALLMGILLKPAGLLLCTAYLTDAAYNPFLYFRF